MRWQDLIPLGIRKRVAFIRRTWSDYRSGMRSAFARERKVKDRWPAAIQIKQPVKKSYLFENKLHNINLAANWIRRVEIRPGEVFSFWNAAGYPGSRRGYRVGRNLVNGELQESIGGGLCQLSGLIYHLALQAGLEVVERHPHSLDIYTEATRYTPLGADATVSFGYKDLRIRNNLNTPIRFDIAAGPAFVIGNLRCPEPIEPCELQFKRYPLAGGEEEVRTFRKANDGEELVAVSRYRKESKPNRR